MAESVTLAAPITKTPTTAIQLTRMIIDMPSSSIYVEWKGDDGQVFSANYPTPAPSGSTQPTGAALLTALNTANMSTTSLVKRIYQRLIADGYIAGTVSGTPS